MGATLIRETILNCRDPNGAERLLWLAGGRGRREDRGIVLSMRTEQISGGEIAYALISNQGPEPVQLQWLRLELDTGFDAAAPARFFKHGYQSWSASYPVAVGHPGPLRTRALLTRIAHQSEIERPDNAPEHATSELFTIIESDSSHERLLCGFAGAANQITTMTVTSPGGVTARALFDGIWLLPGTTVAAEPLAWWHSGEDAALMAARWAVLLGERMNARVKAPYLRGWCSWYQYFGSITEDALRSNLRKLRELRREFPLDVVQLDDGFQAALGDWDRTNLNFPSGLKKIAAEIRDAGFTAGLWTAPFLATADSNLMLAHPDWFIRDDNDEPLRVVKNAGWTTGEDKYAYALDPSRPAFSAHLEQLFNRLVHEFGYEYLKLDFLFAAAAEGRRHDSNLTRAQVLRRGLEAIRRGAGDRTFILGCGCPLGPAVGVVDGMRIGPDVAPYWGGGVEPGTRVAIDAIIARSFMHRRLWLNDPDCLMLRTRETHLSPEERFALASAIAVSGGMLLLSDDLNLLDAESGKLFRMVAQLGTKVDNAAGEEPPIATGLMQHAAIRIIVARGPDCVLYLLLNASDMPQDISLASMFPQSRQAALIGPGGETEMPEKLELPAHSSRIIRC